MTTAIHLCADEDIGRLAELVARARFEADDPIALEDVTEALAPLAGGAAQGAAWLFGPSRAPTGYVILSFRFSLAHGGTIGTIEDIYVRPTIRRRGIATEVLLALASALRDGGIVAVTMQLSDDAPEALPRLAARSGLGVAERSVNYTRRL